MKYTIWIVTPPDYIFSKCFFDQAHPLRDALIELGHECEIVTDIATMAMDNVIVLGAHLLQNPIPPHWIIYNLELFEKGSLGMSEHYISLLKRCRVWDYHEGNTSKLGITPKIVQVGYMPCMERIKKTEPAIDVLHYGSMNERRHKVIQQLLEKGINVQTAFKVFGKVRDDILARTKLVLNVSFYESKIFNITRCGYLFANKIAVVSEVGPGREQVSDAAVFADYDNLADACVLALKNYEAIGQRGYEVFSKLRQTDYLKNSL